MAAAEAYRQKRQAYVKEKLNPVLQSLVAAALAEMPPDPRGFVEQWLRQHCATKAVRVKEEQLSDGRRRKSYWSHTSVVQKMGLVPEAGRAGKDAAKAEASGDFGLAAPVAGDKASAERGVRFGEGMQFKEESIEGGGRRKSYWSSSSAVVAMASQPQEEEEESSDSDEEDEKEEKEEGAGGGGAPAGRRASRATPAGPGDFGLAAPSPDAGEPLPPADKASSDKGVRFGGGVQFKEETVDGGAKRKSYWSRQSVVVTMAQQPREEKKEGEKKDKDEAGGAGEPAGKRASVSDFGLPPPEEASAPTASGESS